MLCAQTASRTAPRAKLARWFHEHSRIPAQVYWDYQLVINYIEPLARKGVEPFASYLDTPKGGTIPRFAEAGKIAVLVVGGEKNAYGSRPISAT